MTKRIKTYYPFMKAFSKNVARDFTSMGSLLFLIMLSFLLARNFSELIFLVFGLILLELVSAFLKLLLFKHRPEKESYTNVIEKISASSFPSVHAARSTFIYSYFAYLYTGTYKSYLFILIVVLVGVTRIVLKKHYYIDVLAGVLLGVVFMFIYSFIYLT